MRKIQCQRCANYFPDNRAGAVHIAGCRRYNGWANYETWATALWLDNEAGAHEYHRERARELIDENPRDRALQTLADELKASHEDGASERLGASSDVFSDLLNAALAEVDWAEIAEHFAAE